MPNIIVEKLAAGKKFRESIQEIGIDQVNDFFMLAARRVERLEILKWIIDNDKIDILGELLKFLDKKIIPYNGLKDAKYFFVRSYDDWSERAILELVAKHDDVVTFDILYQGNDDLRKGIKDLVTLRPGIKFHGKIEEYLRIIACESADEQFIKSCSQITASGIADERVSNKVQFLRRLYQSLKSSFAADKELLPDEAIHKKHVQIINERAFPTYDPGREIGREELRREIIELAKKDNSELSPQDKMVYREKVNGGVYRQYFEMGGLEGFPIDAVYDAVKKIKLYSRENIAELMARTVIANILRDFEKFKGMYSFDMVLKRVRVQNSPEAPEIAELPDDVIRENITPQIYTYDADENPKRNKIINKQIRNFLESEVSKITHEGRIAETRDLPQPSSSASLREEDNVAPLQDDKTSDKQK